MPKAHAIKPQLLTKQSFNTVTWSPLPFFKKVVPQSVYGCHSINLIANISQLFLILREIFINKPIEQRLLFIIYDHRVNSCTFSTKVF